MGRMLIPVLQEVRNLIGLKRQLTVVFDRSGWSPRLFQSILGMEFNILTKTPSFDIGKRARRPTRKVSGPFLSPACIPRKQEIPAALIHESLI
jgi:hypothetical protein